MLLKLPDTECPTIWINDPRTRRPVRWHKIDDPVKYSHTLAALQWERKLGELLVQENWENLYFRRRDKLLLWVSVDDITTVGRKRKLSSDLGKIAIHSTSRSRKFGMHSKWVATVAEETIWTKTEMFQRIATSHVEKLTKKQVTILRRFRHVIITRKVTRNNVRNDTVNWQ